ncbi:hypothetical protein [uncultured Clostridium sp.]|uniref:hypothetical protein n=1 Tax=uncultured Clostridium sp. TaxID=59620 RepID=UPI002602575A|nr:hypothetical protein [uncultured Clostridium sp.]
MEFNYIEKFVLNINDFAIFEKISDLLKYFTINKVQYPIPYIIRKYLFNELSKIYDANELQIFKLKFLKLKSEDFALIYTMLLLRLYLLESSNIHHQSEKKHLPATITIIIDYTNKKITTESFRYNLGRISEILGLDENFVKALTKFFFENYYPIMKNLYGERFPLPSEIT